MSCGVVTINGAGNRYALRQRELDVARARRHVDHEVIELTPVGVAQQLIQRRSHHGPAPDHRLLDVDQESDRHRDHAVIAERLDALAIG